MPDRAPPAAIADPLAVDEWVEAAARALTAPGWFCALGAIPAPTVSSLAGELHQLVDDDRLHREHEVLPTTAPRVSIAGWFRLNNMTGEFVDPPREQRQPLAAHRGGVPSCNRSSSGKCP